MFEFHDKNVGQVMTPRERIFALSYDLPAQRLVGDKAHIGEMREILGAGYPRAFGMAGIHPLFHTASDSAAMTSPALLEPVVQAFVKAVRAVAEGP